MTAIFPEVGMHGAREQEIGDERVPLTIIRRNLLKRCLLPIPIILELEGLELHGFNQIQILGLL